MVSIVTTKQVQQKIGEISASIGEKAYIVTNRGEGRMILLPYYDGCDEKINEYMEDFEMIKNGESLKSKYSKSAKSGRSTLTV